MRNSFEFEARVRQLADEKNKKRNKKIAFFTSFSTVVCACAMVLLVMFNNHQIKYNSASSDGMNQHYNEYNNIDNSFNEMEDNAAKPIETEEESTVSEEESGR